MSQRYSFKHPPGGSTTHPGGTVANKTGVWRTFKPVVDFEKCRGCGVCVRFCPDGCIDLQKTGGQTSMKAVIDYDYCKGCRICESECPFKAISSSVEEK